MSPGGMVKMKNKDRSDHRQRRHGHRERHEHTCSVSNSLSPEFSFYGDVGLFSTNNVDITKQILEFLLKTETLR